MRLLPDRIFSISCLHVFLYRLIPSEPSTCNIASAHVSAPVSRAPVGRTFVLLRRVLYVVHNVDSLINFLSTSKCSLHSRKRRALHYVTLSFFCASFYFKYTLLLGYLTASTLPLLFDFPCTYNVFTTVVRASILLS